MAADARQCCGNTGSHVPIHPTSVQAAGHSISSRPVEELYCIHFLMFVLAVTNRSIIIAVFCVLAITRY